MGHPQRRTIGHGRCHPAAPRARRSSGKRATGTFLTPHHPRWARMRPPPGGRAPTVRLGPPGRDGGGRSRGARGDGLAPDMLLFNCARFPLARHYFSDSTTPSAKARHARVVRPSGLWPDLPLLILITLAAALARGFSGFGAALIFVPLASALLGPQVAVPLLLVTDGVMTAGMIPGAARTADRGEVLTMAAGALVGVPVGVWVLGSLDPLAIRWAIVALAALMLGLLLSGWRYHGRPRAGLTVLVGALSGLFSGAAQIGGPPVVPIGWAGPHWPRGCARTSFCFSP